MTLVTLPLSNNARYRIGVRRRQTVLEENLTRKHKKFFKRKDNVRFLLSHVNGSPSETFSCSVDRSCAD